jgi:hypothetical protein
MAPLCVVELQACSVSGHDFNSLPWAKSKGAERALLKVPGFSVCVRAADLESAKREDLP